MKHATMGERIEDRLLFVCPDEKQILVPEIPYGEALRLFTCLSDGPGTIFLFAVAQEMCA